MKDIEHKYIILAYHTNIRISKLPYDIFFAENRGNIDKIIENVISRTNYYSHYQLFVRWEPYYEKR